MNHRPLARHLGLAFLISSLLGLSYPVQAAPDAAFESWLQFQTVQSLQKIELNISPTGTAPGVVIASPERNNPPYYFHWVRDAALTMDTIETLFENSTGGLAQKYELQLINYARFSRSNQTVTTLSGIAEPKFNVDGSSFRLEWCRPQNDGPALRALTLIHFATALLVQNQTDFVEQELYNPHAVAESVIKADLDFVGTSWRAESCDIWEETNGQHFYTRLVQWRALTAGAELSKRLGDKNASEFYAQQAALIHNSFDSFWNSAANSYMPSLYPLGQLNLKPSHLDSQVVLGFLHSKALPFNDPRLLNTVEQLVAEFKTLYPLNQGSSVVGVGIGRYLEDKYDGASNVGGNPWFLITAAFANVSYKTADALIDQGQLDLAKKYFAQGDQFLACVRAHADVGGSLSEQFDRSSGAMKSARDLTWSHVELLQASWARSKVLPRLKLN